MSATDRLILFTRYPQPGQAKTRLIPALGAAGAAELQRQMTEHTLAQVAALRDVLSIEIWFATSENPDEQLETERLLQAWLGRDWVYRSQGNGDLGTRMTTALQTAFTEGRDRVVIIGTDCPELNADRLQQAFQALSTHELVLGPATDGGYYLIGLSRLIPELLQGIAWSTAHVLAQTLTIARSLNLNVALLDPLADIDRPEDLEIWQAVQRQIRQAQGDRV